jgi:putative transposase
MKLPGLPGSDRGILKWMRRQGWESRIVKGRGGEHAEYLVPDEILMQTPEPSDDAPGVAASESAELANKARWNKFFRLPARKQAKAVKRNTALQVDRGLIDPPEGFIQLPERTLRRLRHRIKGHEHNPRIWSTLLIDERAGRPRAREYSSRIDDLFRADFLRPERPSASSSYDRIKGIAAAENLQLPTLKTLVKRMRADLPWQSIRLTREGKTAFEASYPAQERDRSVFRVMQALNADGWRADNEVGWPDGEIARPIIVSGQDLYSGAILGWRVDRTENLDLIRTSFGEVLRTYGIPEAVYIDNGHAFAGHWLSGRTPHRFRFKVRAEEPQGLFNLLGVKVHWALPHHGQSKIIERAHREYADRISRHPRLAGSWTGANTVDRPEVRAKHPASLADFLAVVESEIKAHNERIGRSAKNCHGRSFWQTFREDYERVPVRKATAEQLALALMAVEGVKVSSRDGTFRLAGENRYYSEAVAQFAGRTICVRFDPQHLKSQVYCYQISGGEFIGAAECIAAVGFDDVHAAREHARLKRQNLRAHQTILANERRMGTRELVELLPHETPAPEFVSSKIVRLFQPKLDKPVVKIDDAQVEEMSPEDRRFERYSRLKALPPQSISADDATWLRVYEGGYEFAARRKLGLVAG